MAVAKLERNNLMVKRVFLDGLVTALILSLQQAGLLHVPHLGMTKQHIGWRLGIVATKHPNLTSTVGTVTCSGDVLLIDIQVDATATCNDRQQVDLVQASPNEGRGAFEQIVVMLSGVVYGGDEAVGPRAINEEGIVLRLRAINAKHYSAKLAFDDGHLDLVGQVAKVRGLRKAEHIRILGLCDGMIGSPTERTAKLPVRRGHLGPIVGVVCT